MKKKKMKKIEKKKSNIGCLGVILIFSVLFFGGGWVMYYGYQQAELKSTNEKFIYAENKLRENFSGFSNKEYKELTVKLFLIKECAGGEETINKLYDIDMNVLASACSSLLGQKIDINEITIGLNQSKSKKNFLEKLNEMNWFPALEGYKSYLNQ